MKTKSTRVWRADKIIHQQQHRRPQQGEIRGAHLACTLDVCNFGAQSFVETRHLAARALVACHGRVALAWGTIEPKWT